MALGLTPDFLKKAVEKSVTGEMSDIVRFVEGLQEVD